jgi:hypothetical protein
MTKKNSKNANLEQQEFLLQAWSNKNMSLKQQEHDQEEQQERELGATIILLARLEQQECKLGVIRTQSRKIIRIQLGKVART